VTIIEPPGKWQFVDLGELWRFRELLGFLVWRDVKVRYKQTVLGAAWAVLQPLLTMIVFSIVFGRMAGVPSGGVPYPLFALAGLLPWTFFATAVANAGNSVVGSERLITKIYFPRLAVPFAAVGAAAVDFAVALGLLFALMVWYGVLPGPGLVLAPLIFALVLLAALGIGALLAALNVAYRDFRYVIPFLVQLWMFATPSVYMDVSAATAPLPPATHPTPPPSTPMPAATDAARVRSQPAASVPASQRGGPGRGLLRTLLALNPMDGLIGSFRAAVLGGAIPWRRLGGSTAAVAGLLVAGCLYFRRVEDSFADII
jgi:lipopolysaccharide transport system permease protein